MNTDTLIQYMENKPGSTTDYPFDPHIRVFKVKGKMFAAFSENEEPLRLNLKCDPEEALMLRDVFEAVVPGYHMNKKHWNTVLLDGSLPNGEIQRMIDNSYQLVVKGLKKADKAALALESAQSQDQANSPV